MNTEIDDIIDDLPMHEMDTIDALASINPNSLRARLDRRKVRYFLYSLRSIETGKKAPADLPKELASQIESQDGFDGWKNFANTWDVALNNPYKVVSRRFSEEEEWDRVVQAKFPKIKPDGGVHYPDMEVKAKVDDEIENQKEIHSKRELDAKKENEEG